jgi:hypothetical protein
MRRACLPGGLVVRLTRLSRHITIDVTSTRTLPRAKALGTRHKTLLARKAAKRYPVRFAFASSRPSSRVIAIIAIIAPTSAPIPQSTHITANFLKHPLQTHLSSPVPLRACEPLDRLRPHLPTWAVKSRVGPPLHLGCQSHVLAHFYTRAVRVTCWPTFTLHA